MKRILIVDDNTEFLQTLSTVLSGDFDTIKAKGVKEALDILQKITVDAVCSDFNMEDGTGLDLLEIIRQQGLKTPFLELCQQPSVLPISFYTNVSERGITV